MNQTGELKLNTWCSSIQVSSWSKTSASSGGGEVAVLLAGRAVGPHHPVDELAQARLALRRADGAAEVLGGDDVGRVDRPEVGELHAALLEVDRAVAPVGHHDVAALPGHLVVRVHAGGGVDPLDVQPAPALLALGADGLRHDLVPFGRCPAVPP